MKFDVGDLVTIYTGHFYKILRIDFVDDEPMSVELGLVCYSSGLMPRKRYRLITSWHTLREPKAQAECILGSMETQLNNLKAIANGTF
jgi:hypothetical protein